MNVEQLNLARKWRSKNFEQIIGQDLSVRILKNSLYLDQYFPVYLFAGQRGCGKTTMARVFAASVNCKKLPDFQKNPKEHSMPCMTCDSCAAFAVGRHPDFIEIDAASNTGVDNVRQIIDASSLLPIMGRKKIYLIDEAHMLSKAAFNAFLKLMEEPPSSVLFILATTDTQKIIDTVRSRCFQLFFKPVDQSPLVNHLVSICQAEKINCDEQALVLIAKETDGSVRDAINLLERVRFASTAVTKQVVQQVLGHIDDERLLQCFEIILHKESASLISYLHKNRFEQFDPNYIWKKLSEITRSALWVKYGITPLAYAEYAKQLQFLVRGCSLKKLTDILEKFYVNEPLFTKTNAQYSFLEMILLQLCQKNESNSNSGTPSIASSAVGSDTDQPLEEDNDDPDEENDDDEQNDQSIIIEDEESQSYAEFIAMIEPLNDKLLTSILKQAHLKKNKENETERLLVFSKDLLFFKDVIYATKDIWYPFLCKALGKSVSVDFIFEENSPNEKPVQKPEINSVKKMTVPVKENNHFMPTQKKNYYTTKPSTVAYRKEQIVDISNKELWPFANLVISHFPGTITEIKE